MTDDYKKDLSSPGHTDQSSKDTSPRHKFSFPRLPQLRHLPRSLSALEKRLIYLCLLIIILGLGWLGYSYYIKNTEVIPDVGGIYTEGLVGEPQYVNPAYSSTNEVDRDLTALIFSGLLKYDKNNDLVPDLAERYEISDDQLNYTFFLRRGVTWHDGEEFTADDVIFTVQVIKNPAYESPLQANFQDVAVEKLDDYTVKFTLIDNVFVPFLNENTSFGILPKHLWENVDPDKFVLSENNLKPIGTGPFKFQEYRKDKDTGDIIDFILERNDDYYEHPPYLEEMTLAFYPDYPSAISAYNRGEIEGISKVTTNEKLNIKKDINSYDLKLPSYFAIFFNKNNNDVLLEDSVRAAMATALDRERIISEGLDGQGVVVDSPIPPNFRGHNPDITKYEYDKDSANDILHENWWRDVDEEGYRWKDGAKLEVTLTIPNREEMLMIAEIIKENWNDMGMQVNIDSYDPVELQTEYIQPRNYQALLYGQLLGHDPDPYPFWHSIQRDNPGLNLTSLQDPEIDDLLETARKMTDEEERVSKYLHFQNTLTEQIPAIFLYSPTYTYGVTPKIQGIELEYITYPSDRFMGVNEWYINTKREGKDKV